jgi:hypothetical protein
MVQTAELQGTSPLYWEVADADPLFPVAYAFRDLLTAATLALLWATRTIAWSGMQHLRRAVRELTHCTEAEGILRADGEGFETQCGDFMDMARRVCRSVAFCASQEVGARSVMAPLTMASDVLSDWPGNEVEKRWIQEKLNVLQSNGMRIMRYLR